MPITTTTPAQFTADTVADIYRRMLVGNELAPHFRSEVSVTKPRVLPLIDGDANLLQTSVDNPRIGTNDSGAVLISPKLLAVNEAMVFTSINVDDWRADFPEFQPSGNMLDLTLDGEVSGAVMDIIHNRVESQIADNLIQGDTATGSTLKFTDGLLKKIDADADVIDVANAGVITTTNILAILESCAQAIPTTIRKRANVKFFMSYGTEDIANEANRSTQQNNTLLNTGDVSRVFNKYPIVPLESIPADRIVVAIGDTSKTSNLVQGFWFQNDAANFMMYKEAMGDKDWAIIFRFLMGMQYRTGKEIVNYLGT